MSDLSLSTMRAASALDKAIESFQQELNEEQPPCMDPTENYVKCMSFPDDIDDTEFLVHPMVPKFTTLQSLKGTSDYEMGKEMVEAFRASVTPTDCDETGKYGLAVYNWLASDQLSMITATSLVKDFMAPSNWGGRTVAGSSDMKRYMCGTGPLTEEYSLARSNPMKEIGYSFEVVRGFDNIDQAIENIKMGNGKEQPVCMDNMDNYVKCMTFPEDIEDTAIVVHPVFPEGKTLGELEGTNDYMLAKNMIQSFRDAVSPTGCESTGNYGVAMYPWISAIDRSEMITATSLVKDFMGPADFGTNSNNLRRGQEMERYICGTGPIAEDELDEDEKPNNGLVTVSIESVHGIKNLEDAVSRISMENYDIQPNCMNPTTNYVKCLTLPDDVDETAFIIHPVVPAGTTLKMLKGTPDYDMGRQMIEAFRDSVTNSCDESGQLGVAKYPWLSANQKKKVTASSIVKDFQASAKMLNDLGADSFQTSESIERYMCGTGPLDEVVIIEKPKIDVDVDIEPEIEESAQEESPSSSNDADPIGYYVPAVSVTTTVVDKPKVNVASQSFLEDKKGTNETTIEVNEPEPEEEPNESPIGEEQKEDSEGPSENGNIIKESINLSEGTSPSTSSPSSGGTKMTHFISMSFTMAAIIYEIFVL